MKKIFLPLFACLLLFTSCKKETKIAAKSDEKSSTSNISTEKMTELSEKKDELSEQKSTETTANSEAATQIAEAVKKADLPIANIHGNWKITKVEGKLFVKMNDKGPEVNAPLGIWVGKEFNFKDDGNMQIKDAGKSMVDSPYKFDGNELTAPQFGGQYGMKIVVNGNKMTMTQTPENYYSMMEKEGKMPVEQVKKMFRIPENIVFHLEKK